MLNKKAYYEANKSHLGVKLRRFQQWFHSQASDKEAIKAKTKPKPELVRKQNKVEFQVDRTRYIPQNKLDKSNTTIRQTKSGQFPGPPPKRPRHKPKASQIPSKK